MAVEQISPQKIRTNGLRLTRGATVLLLTRVEGEGQEDDCPLLGLIISVYKENKTGNKDWFVEVELDTCVDTFLLPKRTGESFAQAVVRLTSRIVVSYEREFDLIEIELFLKGKRTSAGFAEICLPSQTWSKSDAIKKETVDHLFIFAKEV